MKTLLSISLMILTSSLHFAPIPVLRFTPRIQEEWYLVKRSVTPFHGNSPQLFCRDNFEDQPYSGDPRQGSSPICISDDTENVCALFFDGINDVQNGMIKSFSVIAYEMNE